MATSALISESEYLTTTYRPDCDFLEGEVVERNLGEQSHARIQHFFSLLFGNNGKAWGVRALPEQRVQVRANRYRIPDVCLIRRGENEEILRKPPLLCVEVLSSADTLRQVKLRVDDYAAMGVEHIWVIDPWKRLAYYASPSGFEQPEDGFLRIEGTEIAVSLAEVFAELDED